MSQGVRDMLSNRRFAIPLIILLAFCFIGLLMIGFLLIFGAGNGDDDVAQATDTAVVEPTDTLVPTDTAAPTDTPRPTATRVLPATPVVSGTGSAATSTAAAAATSEAAGGDETPEATDTAEPTPTSESVTGGEAATPTAEPEDELADTGIGWGLVLFSAVGLGALVIAARRLRLAG